MTVTYKRHPLDKRRPAPRFQPARDQDADLANTFIAAARAVQKMAGSLATAIDHLGPVLRDMTYTARLHARHPEYHGGEPLARYSLKEGRYVPVPRSSREG